MSQELPTGEQKPNATISDAVNYVSQDPSVLGRIYSGIKEIITVIALIFKPSPKIK